MSKLKAINFLYKDWLEYKKYYKNNMGFEMKETFNDLLKKYDADDLIAYIMDQSEKD
jgi:uncharacterized protein with von Willebrand factor type A (vWA) domain